jgi:uncharacterized repeat protein (TIGR01451 family)
MDVEVPLRAPRSGCPEEENLSLYSTRPRNRTASAITARLLVASLVAGAASLVLTGTAAGAQQTATVTFGGVSPQTGSGFGIYNYSIDYAGPTVVPFDKGATAGHCIEADELAGDGSAILRSGPDLAIEGPGGALLSKTDQDRLLWLLDSSAKSQAAPSPGLSTAQEASAHQAAVWSITDSALTPADAGAAARATALIAASAAGGQSIATTASLTATGGATCAGTARQLVVTGAPGSATTLTITSPNGSFPGGAKTAPVTLDAAGRAQIALNGAVGTVTVTATVIVNELIQVEKTPGQEALQDFAEIARTPTPVSLQVSFKDCEGTSTAGETPIARRPTLQLTKSGPRRARAGEAATYTVTVRNTGRAAASKLVIRDRLPKGMVLFARPAGATIRDGVIEWRVASLGAKGSITRRVRVRMLASTEGRICNAASVSAGNARSRSATRCTFVLGQSVTRLPAVTG